MKNKLITTLLRSLLCVIGIYLLFIPIFYFYNFIYTQIASASWTPAR